MHHGRTHERFVLVRTTYPPQSCRLYLNILRLSGMTHPDKITINHNYLIEVKSVYPTSKLKWPTQKNPSDKI